MTEVTSTSASIAVQTPIATQTPVVTQTTSASSIATQTPVEATVTERTTSAFISAKTEEKPFVCPGHTEFFHHYSIYDKAKRKAAEAVEKLLKNDDVTSANYTLLHKDSVEGKNSGYFTRLNAIYKYAVLLNFTHTDDSDECAFYTAFKAEKAS
ncbi:MAG: hypothetical protein S4CHLAM7_08030 [Chlamydiae bacterium]|nr:hypothetical protein [Chlamydiota bacterium]